MNTNSREFVVVVPARFASTRLPGKPLLKIGDKTLIRHVCEQAAKSQAQNVIVASDDQRIIDHVNECGFQGVMTSVDCQSGTDRIAEAVQALKLPDNTVVVNLQGDEPFMPANVIDQVANNLILTPQASMSTGCEILSDQSEWTNPDVVKVVRDKNNMALYFSRSLIPFCRDGGSQSVYRHLGIYAYTVGYIKKFASLAACQLEQTEKLEQLRTLWHGDKIVVDEVVEATGIGVDTPADLAKARAIHAGDKQWNG